MQIHDILIKLYIYIYINIAEKAPKYNVKTCMYIISALYQMINLNVGTKLIKCKTSKSKVRPKC